MPSLTRRFSLARVPSMFFGNGSGLRLADVLGPQGSGRLVEGGKDARVVRAGMRGAGGRGR